MGLIVYEEQLGRLGQLTSEGGKLSEVNWRAGETGQGVGNARTDKSLRLNREQGAVSRTDRLQGRLTVSPQVDPDSWVTQTNLSWKLRTVQQEVNPREMMCDVMCVNKPEEAGSRWTADFVA